MIRKGLVEELVICTIAALIVIVLAVGTYNRTPDPSPDVDTYCTFISISVILRSQNKLRELNHGKKRARRPYQTN